MDPIKSFRTRTQERAVRPRTQSTNAGTATALLPKLSDLPSDVIRHVLAHGDTAAHVALLQEVVLENRAVHGPWSAGTRDTISDVALLEAHPEIAAAFDKLVLDVPIMSLAQASLPATKADPFSRRHQAFTARCLWGSLAAPGELTVERLAILNLITPSPERRRETLDLLNVKLYSHESAGLNDDGRCALLKRLQNASFPPEITDGHIRAMPILMQLVHGLEPERKIAELRKLVSHATKHNLDDLFHSIVECVPELLTHSGNTNQTIALCKDLFLVPAHDEIHFLGCDLGRGDLALRPHIKQLSDVLHAHENLPSHLHVILSAVDGDLYYAYDRDVYEHGKTIELLNASHTTMAAKADYCDLIGRYENAEQLANSLSWLAAEVRHAEVPTNAADQKDYARILALALHCARDEWSYPTEDIDEPELPDGESRFEDLLRHKLDSDAKVLLKSGQLSPDIELSLLQNLTLDSGSPTEVHPYRATQDFNNALRRCAPIAAKRVTDADFFHLQSDLYILRMALHGLGCGDLLMTPAERGHFEKQVSTVFSFLGQPKVFDENFGLALGNHQMFQLVQTYRRVAGERTPPLPLPFAENFAKLALKLSGVVIPEGEPLPKTIERLYSQTGGKESESTGFYGEGYLHGVHAYRNALQLPRLDFGN